MKMIQILKELHGVGKYFRHFFNDDDFKRGLSGLQSAWKSWRSQSDTTPQDVMNAKKELLNIIGKILS